MTDNIGTPLSNITVDILNAVNATEVTSTQTDVDGFYTTGSMELLADITLKLRFIDNTAVYLSEYFGAGGADDFNLGEAMGSSTREGTNAELVQNSPSDIIADITEATVNDAELTTQLNQATALLNDNNPNNDTASCGVLTGFTNKVNVRERKGELSTVEADSLRDSVSTAKSLLGCP